LITREQLIASMRHETNVIKHLATKVPAGQFGWRPTPKQRSTLELLQYLTTCGSIGVKLMVNGNWDHAEALEAASAEVTPENFAAAMDRQMADMEADIRSVAEGDFLTKPAAMPWGVPTVVGIGLVDCGLKPLVAYRMQLFLYAKESGSADIGPANCWVGRDPPKKPA
jgi:thiamine monophosphate synthase